MQTLKAIPNHLKPALVISNMVRAASFSHCLRAMVYRVGKVT